MGIAGPEIVTKGVYHDGTSADAASKDRVQLLCHEYLLEWHCTQKD